MLPIFPQSNGGITKARVDYRFRRSINPQPITVETYIRAGDTWVASGNMSQLSLPNSDIIANLMKEATEREGKVIATDTRIVVTVQNPSVPVLDFIDLPGAESVDHRLTKQLILEQVRAENSESIYLLISDGNARFDHNALWGVVAEANIQVRINYINIL